MTAHVGKEELLSSLTDLGISCDTVEHPEVKQLNDDRYFWLIKFLCSLFYLYDSPWPYLKLARADNHVWCKKRRIAANAFSLVIL